MPRHEPFKYQLEGARQIEKWKGRALLADEQGLGKTKTTLMWLQSTKKIAKPIMIVCPKSVKEYWQIEALDQIGLRAMVINGRSQLPKLKLATPDCVIINYAIVQHHLAWLLRYAPVTVIIDEVQFLQNRAAKCTRAVAQVCALAEHVIGLSGTPCTNRPAELWSGLNMIRPDLYPTFINFGQRYCSPRRRPWGVWEYKGATNLDELHRNLRKHLMIRRLKSDIEGQLPPIIRRFIPMKMKNAAEYELASTDFATWAKKTLKKSKIKTALKSEQITKLGYLKRLAAKLKVPYIVKWVNAWLEENPGKKLVVFGWHKKMLHALHRYYKGRSVLIDGSTAQEKRGALVKIFQHKPEIQLFLGNIQAAGTGLDGLQYATNYGVCLEMDWRPGFMSQMEKRLDRTGQKVRCWWWYLMVPNTVEDYLCEVVQRKERTLGKIFDGKAAPDGMDIYDQIQEIILKKGKL